MEGNPRQWIGSSFPNGSSFRVWIYLDISDEQGSARAFTANPLFDERVMDFVVSLPTHWAFWGLRITESSLGIARSLI